MSDLIDLYQSVERLIALLDPVVTRLQNGDLSAYDDLATWLESALDSLTPSLPDVAASVAESVRSALLLDPQIPCETCDIHYPTGDPLELLAAARTTLTALLDVLRQHEAVATWLCSRKTQWLKRYLASRSVKLSDNQRKLLLLAAAATSESHIWDLLKIPAPRVYALIKDLDPDAWPDEAADYVLPSSQAFAVQWTRLRQKFGAADPRNRPPGTKPRSAVRPEELDHPDED